MDYRTRSEEVQRQCSRCARVTSSTTTNWTPYYCMARKQYVSPISICPWFTEVDYKRYINER